jgi:pimeloyl-ACP methyl ester carboxylesterase
MPLMQVQDIKLYYEVSGHGPALLLIHGLGSAGRDWECQIPYFSPHFQVISVDLRGHGKSTIARGAYSIALFAADLAELVKGLNCGPAHIVGISMGGMIGLQLALDYPDLCASLTSVNCKADYRLRTLRDILFAARRLFFLFILGMGGVGRHLSVTLFPKPEHEPLRRKFLERWSDNTISPYLKSLRAIGSWSAAGRLHQIRCATLLIAADHDYTPVEAKKTMAAEIPNARLVIIQDARHATPMEKPEEFNRVVATFLQEQEQITPSM